MNMTSDQWCVCACVVLLIWRFNLYDYRLCMLHVACARACECDLLYLLCSVIIFLHHVSDLISHLFSHTHTHIHIYTHTQA